MRQVDNVQAANKEQMPKNMKVYDLTWRAIIIGLVGIVFFSFHQSRSMAGLTPGIGGITPSIPGVLIVIILLLSSWLLISIGLKKKPFEKSELAAIYIIIGIGELLCGAGYFGFFVFTLMGLQRYNISDPVRYTPFIERMPSFMLPSNEADPMGFWRGGVEQVPWRAWIAPIFMWALLGLAMFWVFICAINLLHHRWAEREKLIYPLTIPVTDVLGTTGENKNEAFLRNTASRLGFAVVLLVFLYESFIARKITYTGIAPIIDLSFLMRNFKPRWNQALNIHPPAAWQVTLEPAKLGIAYLLNLDVLFSGWFFYLAFLVWRIIASGLQLNHPSKFDTFEGWHYPTQLTVGAVIGVVVYYLVTSKEEIKEILVSAFGLSKEDESTKKESNGLMSHRFAFWGMIFGLIFTWGFLVLFIKYDPILSLAWLIIFYCAGIAIARVRAEVGLPMRPVTIGNRYELFFAEITGLKAIGWENIMSGGFLNVFSYGGFGVTASLAAESYKIADSSGLKRNKLPYALLIAAAVSMVIPFFTGLPYIYKYGGDQFPVWYTSCGARNTFWLPFQHVPSRYTAPKYIPLIPVAVAIIGVVVTGYLRSAFLWFPLHPIGWVLGPHEFGPTFVWPLFQGWVIKFFIYRWGGSKLYKTLRPFFVSLLIGSVIIQGVVGMLNSILLALTM